MSEDLEVQGELDLTLPAEFDRAPAWARSLAQQARRDRHHLGGELIKLQGSQRAFADKLGKEPDSDGKGGEGLIGDVRRLARELAQLNSLKVMGVGFLAALSIFGALILLGVAHWVQSLTGAGK